MKFKPIFFLSVFFFIQNAFLAQSLPAYSVTVSDPQSKGYYFLAPTKIKLNTQPIIPLMILDSSGALVYYKKIFAPGSSDFKIHWNGMISYSANNKFYLMDSTFTKKDSVRAKNGLLPDLHDLQILPNGHFVILGLENVAMDLSAYNYFNGNSSPGSASAIVKCGVIQEQDAMKNVVFEWHCKDNYNFADVDPYFLSDPNNVDWTHLNAVEYDNDGNYLLSVRHFNEITKIRRSDSTIMWRMGGNANQFTFLNDPQKFRAQHDIRRIANGNMTIFDNGRAFPLHPATAKEYQVNEINLTANLVWSYTENYNKFSSAMGNHERLPNGNSLVNYGIANNLNQVFDVVTPDGSKVFELVFEDTLRAYRVFNYPSLPWDLQRPVISCASSNLGTVLNAGSGYNSYMWNNGAATQTIMAGNTTTVSVFVPKGQGGFISSPAVVINDVTKFCRVNLITEQADVSPFVLFPNPASEMLIIDLKGQSSKTQIVLYNSFGTVLSSQEFDNKNVVQLSIAHLPSGIYFLSVNGDLKKIIKN